MSQLIQAVKEVFSAQGRLAQSEPGFLPRQGQTEMAVAVAQCIESGGQLVVEAGTGVGKTYAYLVPALLSGERVLLSTATKTLQDQLFGRDLPRLLTCMGMTARVALLKGRSSYYCPQRAESAHHYLEPGEHQAAHTLKKIEIWARQTVSGDLAELPGLDERSPAIGLVTSTKDNCLGADCPQLKFCFVNQARKEAMSADLVVVNHHLFFADLAVRESGVAELLPTCRVVVFDEAHKLNEIGVEFSGCQVGTRQMLELCREALAVGLAKAKGMAPWNDLVYAVENAIRALRLVFLDNGVSTGRIGWVENAPEGLTVAAWSDAIGALQYALTELHKALALSSPSSLDLSKIAKRCADQCDDISSFLGDCEANHVRWVEVGLQLRLILAPLDIGALLAKQRQSIEAPNTANFLDDWALSSAQEGEHEYPIVPVDVEPIQQQKSWIYTSATLGDEPTLRWFTEPCGLTDARVMTVKSPFDYAAQAGIYIPRHFVKPADTQHSHQVAAFAAQAAMRMGGRTMVLTTTLKALASIGDALERILGDSAGPIVLRQGATTKRELIERFRSTTAPGQPGYVLVASASFWEGVDIPGSALQLVIIDKLPFPPPNDPLVKAICKRLEQQGKNAFQDYFVPEAVVALKQGAGRLIRHENDVGLLVVCDTRLHTMGYGRRVMAALPPMQKVVDDAAFQDYISVLTTISTNG